MFCFGYYSMLFIYIINVKLRFVEIYRELGKYEFYVLNC